MSAPAYAGLNSEDKGYRNRDLEQIIQHCNLIGQNRCETRISKFKLY
jgi:hypothetical protein